MANNDVLDDILSTLDLKGVLYFRTDFSPPWSVAVPPLGAAARFHLVVQGHCHVGFPSGAALTLGPGDLVLVPHGGAHTLADGPGRDAPPLETVLRDAGYEGAGVLALGKGDANAATQMVCGHFSFRDGADHPLLRALPEFLLTTTAIRAREAWLDEVLRLIARRIFTDPTGSTATITRLSEIVFIELLRVGVGSNDAMKSILSAMHDRQIGAALRLMHARPADAWTVESLASAVGMSRSRFAERFRELMAVGPMSYLGDWRLQKALSLLEDTRSSIQQVASRTGYQSPAAFTRAFAGRYGLSPRDYRQKAA